MHTRIEVSVLVLLISGVVLAGCGIDNTLQNSPSESPGYTVLISVQPPISLRAEETWDNWMNPVEAVFHTTFDSSAYGEDGHIGHPHVIKPADHPPSDIFIGMGFFSLKLRGDETVNFSVRLEDLASEATGVGQRIMHCWVEATVTNEESGLSVNKILYPMYGTRGYGYVAKLPLPPGVYQRETAETGDANEDHAHDDQSH